MIIPNRFQINSQLRQKLTYLTAQKRAKHPLFLHIHTIFFRLCAFPSLQRISCSHVLPVPQRQENAQKCQHQYWSRQIIHTVIPLSPETQATRLSIYTLCVHVCVMDRLSECFFFNIKCSLVTAFSLSVSKTQSMANFPAERDSALPVP